MIEQSTLQSCPNSSSSQQPRVKFNLTDNDLSCFISKLPKPLKKGTSVSQPPRLFLGLHGRQLAQPNSCLSFNSGFSSRFLFNPELPEEGEEKQQSESAKEIGSEQGEQQLMAEEVVSQCIRLLTEQNLDHSLPCEKSSAVADKHRAQTGRRQKNGGNMQFNVRISRAVEDGRTTLMLRNIPNKYTQDMIFEQFERTGLLDKYDFFYLPIDYKNQCNVGYAFINLVDVSFVAELYRAFNDRKWSKFNSEKICQVCYARIQGTSQLVNHFRYSNALQRVHKGRALASLEV